MAARNAALSFASSSSLLRGSSSSSSPPAPLLPLLFARAASSRAAASRAAAAAGLKVYKPTTPGMRGRVITSRKDLWKGPPLKQLVGGVGRRGGRNATGQVTVRHRGGGHKSVLRAVDFWRVPPPSSSSDSSGSGAVLRNSRCVFFVFFFLNFLREEVALGKNSKEKKKLFSPLSSSSFPLSPSDVSLSLSLSFSTGLRSRGSSTTRGGRPTSRW